MKNINSFRPTWFVLSLLLGVAHVTWASESVALILTMNDTVIRGDNPHVSLGREGTIDCLSFESEFFRPSTGTAVHRPIKIVKRVDRASPLLANSFGRIDTGTAQFRFYRPNPSGDGTTENFLLVNLEGVRITSVRLIVPSTINPATAADPVMEEITFSYTSYRITYTPNGAEALLRVDRP